MAVRGARGDYESTGEGRPAALRFTEADNQKRPPLLWTTYVLCWTGRYEMWRTQYSATVRSDFINLTPQNLV